uniref:Putative secreted peptide n=1 Tax=Anopheles braziliensis TaxID=58242 RepID=A0A2M3ZR56_9DIPT
MAGGFQYFHYHFPIVLILVLVLFLDLSHLCPLATLQLALFLLPLVLRWGCLFLLRLLFLILSLLLALRDLLQTGCRRLDNVRSFIPKKDFGLAIRFRIQPLQDRIGSHRYLTGIVLYLDVRIGELGTLWFLFIIRLLIAGRLFLRFLRLRNGQSSYFLRQ